MKVVLQQPLDRGKVIITDRFRTAKAAVNHNNATRGLFLFVALPTLLATIYYYIFAADIYVTETKFSVNVEGHAVSPAGGLGAIMTGLNVASSLSEAMVVKEFIQSPTLVQQLEKEVNLKQILNNKNADFLTRVSPNLSREQFAERYKGMVDVVLDDTSGITTLKVRAFSAEESQLLASKILNLTENFVNGMSKRVQDDAVDFSKRELSKAELDVLDINNQITVFRNKNQSFDPSVTTKNILSITSKLEEKLAETKAEIANLRNYMQANNPKITALEAQAASLQSEIASQSNRLASASGSTLANTAQDYELWKAKQEFAEKRYQIAVNAFQSSQAEAMKKSKYLLRIVEPAVPEDAVEPRRLRSVITVFFACLIGYMLMSLIIASIKDHIRP